MGVVLTIPIRLSKDENSEIGRVAGEHYLMTGKGDRGEREGGERFNF